MRMLPWPCALVAVFALIVPSRAGMAVEPTPLERGMELFVREWMPDDSRSHNGDGLGPVFNDSSCVACHNLGGPGGGGPASKNVDLLSAIASGQDQADEGVPAGVDLGLKAPNESQIGALRQAGLRLLGNGQRDEGKKKPREANLDALTKVHAGFRSSKSVVLHRFGTDPSYADWHNFVLGAGPNPLDIEAGGRLAHGRGPAEVELATARQMVGINGAMMGGQNVGGFTLLRSQRNATALFGVGALDAIPDSVIEAAAKVDHPEFPRVHGRPARLPGGKIGRFGWKAQVPSLSEFILTACAVEIGLEVPGRSQASPPEAPAYKAPGVDLSAEECEALTKYVASLPRPVESEAGAGREDRAARAGRDTFVATGCAACHTPKLGDVEGLYSDLLLHNLGPDLGDSGFYGGTLPDSPEDGPPSTTPPPDIAQTPLIDSMPAGDRKEIVGATRQEWRTPPLWGLRDSGPYLHDGRAATIEEAIVMHGGESVDSVTRYFKLTARDRWQLQAFLKTLVAPTPTNDPLASGR
ncbi:di-heme oxidoredictase family protein [Singulisphaera sp. Ch08]|uniref:Di-heme oxidoredictase family protein n=1 Tax=Singulisphaera sp. Ch08 TaxID=3120278 RepID=A0AAU7CPH3_9BACT